MNRCSALVASDRGGVGHATRWAIKFTMSASAFIAYYGLRWDVTDEDEIDALERRVDPRQIAARDHRLKHWWGAASEESYFLLIGSELGNFGWEGMTDRRVDDAEFAQIMDDTKAKLRAAGFDADPALHLQFEPDY